MSPGSESTGAETGPPLRPDDTADEDETAGGFDARSPDPTDAMNSTDAPDPTALDPFTAGPQTTRRQLALALRSVIDPEVGLNIVDLGLIYDLRIEGGEVTVRLTMTTPACPMSGYIKGQVGDVLSMVPGIRRGIIELVWSPAWSPHMIDRDVRGMTFPSSR